ncbi:MAG TPA: DUF1553 domain-containing protein, partial [Armatimonadota bacterium]|nr:DUF1553 domain-containing protein [Armatimonadota bacterium]
RRLEAEIVRDAILSVSGRLDETQFGPGTLDETMKRRSIYFMVKRSRLIPSMVIFDAPDSLQGIALRPSTTVAPQALWLLNNQNVLECARAFAAGVCPNSGTPPRDAVTAAYLTALGRKPGAQELADTLQFLQHQTAAYAAGGDKDPARSALADVCQVLLGLNEFIYVD